MTTTIKDEVLEMIREAGYTAYMRKPEDTWCYYTDGTRIASAQWGRATMIDHGVSVRLYTVHKPNKTTGTGFSLDGDEITPADLAIGFEYAPAWATPSQRRSVVKYRDWAEFAGASEWNSEYKPVNHEELS